MQMLWKEGVRSMPSTPIREDKVTKAVSAAEAAKYTEVSRLIGGADVRPDIQLRYDMRPATTCCCRTDFLFGGCQAQAEKLTARGAAD
jgi:hypothetical protein